MPRAGESLGRSRPWGPFPTILGLSILASCFPPLLCSVAADDPAQERKGAIWQDAVTYRKPDDAATRTRVTRAADWLEKNLVHIAGSAQKCPLHVIAWKDPTLEPDDPKLLAGYVITDTLWAAKALQLFDPAAAADMEKTMQCLGWYGNDLHDVLFHPIDKILHRSADLDIMHGFSLGRFTTADGRTVDLRVFRQRFDPKFDVGHPALFAEHAVYRALYDFWQGRKDEARKRILEVVADDRATHPRDRIVWDDRSGILVDFVTYDAWLAFRNGEKPVCRHFTFKLGVLLYAIRLLGMEKQVGAPLTHMRERLWSAQTESGGLAHFVDVHSDETVTTGRQPTGEATAIAILAEVVEPQRP